MIKFRGVNIFGNEWLYGNLVKIEENRYSILPEINDMPTCKCIADYDVDHNTPLVDSLVCSIKTGKKSMSVITFP